MRVKTNVKAGFSCDTVLYVCNGGLIPAATGDSGGTLN